MEFITSSHGGVKFINDGFAYTKKAEKTNRIRSECSQRKSTGCKGAVTTSLLRDDLYVTVPHNHPAVAAVESLKVKTTMRHLAMAERWFMDGNSAMSPSQFQQLYVIRAPALGASAESCVFGLLRFSVR